MNLTTSERSALLLIIRNREKVVKADLDARAALILAGGDLNPKGQIKAQVLEARLLVLKASVAAQEETICKSLTDAALAHLDDLPTSDNLLEAAKKMKLLDLHEK
jgi:hypothetical protein